MPKALRPVSINGIEFDALIDESRTLDATVPEYSVESGFSVSDAIILDPEHLDMTLYVTDTPVTWNSRHGSGQGRVNSIVKQLEELYYNAYPVTIITSDKTYTSMAIESLQLKKSLETGYSREIPIKFKKIRITSAKTTTIPESYGKSGSSEQNVGTANTTMSSSSTSSSSSGSGSGKSDSKEESKSSILYNVGKSIGLI